VVGPDRYFAILIDRKPLTLDDLALEVFEGGVISTEQALQRSIGHVATTLEEVYNPVEHVIKFHNQYSTFASIVRSVSSRQLTPEVGL
jgi:hypothetical protein